MPRVDHGELRWDRRPEPLVGVFAPEAENLVVHFHKKSDQKLRILIHDSSPRVRDMDRLSYMAKTSPYSAA